MSTLPLRGALIRGALVALANWQVVLIDFALESFYKLALTLPILGGALMVAAIVGADLGSVVGEGVRATADTVIGSLTTSPVALACFLGALAVVAIGGEVVMFALKAGTLAVIVTGERAAGDIHVQPIRLERVPRAGAYRLAAVYDGTARFGRRAVGVALWLGSAYLIIGLLYLGVMGFGFSIASQWTLLPAWPIVVLASTTACVVAVAAINLAYDLLRIIIVTDDCTVPVAVGRLGRFLIEDARQVMGIFSVVGGVLLIATAGSIVATAFVALVAWVPFVGLVVVPLQAAAWVLRGILFQYMSLAGLAAYQTQYRRFSEERFSASARGAAVLQVGGIRADL